MPLQVTVRDEDVRYLNEPAKAELLSAIAKYSEELLQEASRLEAAIKTTPGDPEITSSMVKDATLLLKRGYSRHSRSYRLLGVQVLAALSTFVTGILANAIFSNSDRLKDPVTLLSFLLLIFLAITSTTLVLFMEWYHA